MYFLLHYDIFESICIHSKKKPTTSKLNDDLRSLNVEKLSVLLQLTSTKFFEELPFLIL